MQMAWSSFSRRRLQHLQMTQLVSGGLQRPLPRPWLSLYSLASQVCNGQWEATVLSRFDSMPW